MQIVENNPLELGSASTLTPVQQLVAVLSFAPPTFDLNRLKDSNFIVRIRISNLSFSTYRLILVIRPFVVLSLLTIVRWRLLRFDSIRYRS